MKINSGFRPIGNDVIKNDPSLPHPAQSRTFSELLQQQDGQVTADELQRKLEEIRLQAQRLAKSMTVRELYAYKQLVKRFLEDTVRKGILLKETTGWDRRGRGKRYKLLEEIDRKLLEMADEMLLNEQGRIQLLEHIGEIRGMLINLFF